MRNLDEGLAAHLASGVTTLCWCWRLTRNDGVVQGFTDHDRNLTFDSTLFEAAAGFTASEIKDAVGLNVDNLEVTSALSSEYLREDDLAAGAYDDAAVEIFRVNWQQPDQRLLVRSGSLGEVHRAGTTFAAEVRGLAHYLQQPRGRLFQYGCDADLGDARCTVDTSQSQWRSSGAILDSEGETVIRASGLDSYANDWFSRGLIHFTSGAAEGQAIEIKQHVRRAGNVKIELWQPVRGPLTVGQTFLVTAGCDKRNGTCRMKFSNAVNYRGFPHMPGNDFVAKYYRSQG